MNQEKPLHVRVAEALGCSWPKHYIDGDAWHCRCGCYEHAGGDDSDSSEIFRYDTDWSATGPLIEKYSISVTRTWKAMLEDIPGDNWIACIKDANRGFADGPTPLVAVCNLLLKLHAAGKLKAA